MRPFIDGLIGLCLAAVLAAAAQAGEGIRLAPGFALQKLPQALSPVGAWPDTPMMCRAREQLWLATRDNVWPLGVKKGVLDLPLPIEAFACSEAGTRVLVVAGRLGLLQGKLFVPRLPLPSPQTRLTGGPGDSLILYETQAPARLMRFDGEMVTLVATLAEPIRAVTYAGGFLIVATPTALYRLRPGEPLGLIAPLAGLGEVVSLAVHPRTAELFASTADAVYVIDDGLVTQIAAGLGGALVADADGVFVADGRRDQVLRLFPSAAGR